MEVGPSRVSGIEFDFYDIRYLEHEGIPIIKFDMEATWAFSRPSSSPEIPVFLIPNAKGLNKLTDSKVIAEKLKTSKVSKRDIITGLRDKKIKGGLVSLLQRRQDLII